MKAPSRPTPILITSRDESILRTIYTYRYMTALDVTRLLFSPASLEHVRSILTKLAGGKDLQPNTYLCRFPLPTSSVGRQRIFALGVKGRAYLEREVGLTIDWYFRPHKLGLLGYSHLLHNLILTRFLVAAQCWSRHQQDWKLIRMRLYYELARAPVSVQMKMVGKVVKQQVVPDAWLLFETKTGRKSAVLLEIDRATEYQQRFKQHVRARLAFLQSGEYAKRFEVPGAIIAYATTGQTPEYRETRRATMSTWTMEVLEELGMKHWAGIFRFTSLVFDDIYGQQLFDTPMWFRPDVDAPIQLFSS